MTIGVRAGCVRYVMKTRHFGVAVVALFAALWGAAPAAMAHSGHDHGGATPPPPIAVPGPGTAAVGEAFELVLKADDKGGTLLYLADLDSNEPIGGATIEIDAGAPVTAAATASPGIYTLAWELPAQPVDLTITVSAGGHDDLLLVSGVAKPAAPAAAAPKAAWADDWKRWLSGGGASLAALFGIGMIARRRATIGAAALLLGVVAAGSAFAHAGHDHGPAEPAPVTAGRAVVLAKESQFLLGIRTVKAEARQMADSVRLVGRVVPDPSGYARVQPTQPGRVLSDPQHPLPLPGQTVKRGDVLAVLEPTLTSIDRSEQRARLATLDAGIAQTERQLQRWAGMGEAARRKDIEDARLDLARLRQEKQQVERTALGREMLRAPIDGIVTDLHVVPGQVVAPEVTVVEVVDPDRLRVEAVLYDIVLAERITGGQATTRLLKDHVFGLTLLGSGGRIDPKDQGLHLIFAVADGARWLRLGMPVDVHAHTGTTAAGVAVPRDAVAEAGGRPVIFVKTAPESFEARPVVLGRNIGDWSEIAEGVRSGERIVVQGTLQLLATR